MADPYLVLSPEELAAQQEQARAAANDILVSRGVPGYSSASSQPNMPPPGAPPPPADLPPAGPPPPPPKDSPIARGLKHGAIMAGASLFGPVGAGVAAAANHADLVGNDPGAQQWASKMKPHEAPPASSDTALGPPPPPTSTEDAPIMLNRPGMGQGQMIAPAGMYPHSLSTQAHLGHPVPEEAKAAAAASTGLGLEAADKQHQAEQGYFAGVYNLQAQRQDAIDAANAGHARVQADRDAMVRDRLAKIEATNAEATAAIDPEKAWHDRGVFARALGAIAVGLGQVGAGLTHGENTAAKIVDAMVNREVQAQLENRRLAGQNVAHQERLLDLHLGRLDSQDKAIEATKMGLYDNLGVQMDALAQQRGINTSDADYLAKKSAILMGRADAVNKLGLQEQDDVTKSYQELYHQAQMSGPAAGDKFESSDSIITIPASDMTGNKEMHISVPKESFKELSAMQGHVNQLVALNADAIEARRKYREAVASGDIKAIQTYSNRLDMLQDKHAKLAEKALDDSVVRDEEFKRQMANGVNYKKGLLGSDTKLSGDVDKSIQYDSNQAQHMVSAAHQGAHAIVVQPAETRTREGYKKFVYLPKYEYRPPPIAPEKK